MTMTKDQLKELAKAARGIRPEPRSVPVSIRSVMQRLNRRLATDHKMIKKVRVRSAEYRSGLGDFLMIDTSRNELIDSNITAAKIEEMASKLGCLAPWEVVR